MVEEFSQVALLIDLADHALKAGDVATVVDIAPSGKQITLEFFNYQGDTIAVVPVEPSDVRAVHKHDVMHTRVIESA